ncbi:hypothetical protein AVEN_81262-1 [Araneus ventricosus]|uniref:Uncharacterized protein n=1 Tax=Araneus ventricosus TaxID=182803 RepID=A0A4Y2FGE7_ARAVE|nr:hypothetical protein AVEN_81262-1 [Araneus ventricosus]
MLTPLKPFPDYIIRRDLFETRRRLTSGEHPSNQDQKHCVVPMANSITGSKTETFIGENCLLLRQMKIAELVTPPWRAGSKVLFKLELWRDRGR